MPRNASKTRPDWQPGDLTPEEQVKRMIRVNHAGEYGAKRIYEGQLSVLGKSDCADMIQHMADQEREHLQAFEKYIVERHVRPTVLTPIWHVLGFTLGAGTALMGKEAAMACTVAVEEVIDEHYQKQLHTLGSREPKLTKDIARFREEELEHRDIGLEHDAEKAPGYPLLSAFIKTASRTAIWLSERV